MQMIMFSCCLSRPQESFLKTACLVYQELHGYLGERYGWFNRKDIFSEKCGFMPYTVGLALYRRGLLKTDPPNHPPGYDLSFKATGVGRKLIELEYQQIEHVGYKVQKPKERAYVNFLTRRGPWHILFSQDRHGFMMECGRQIGYYSNPQVIGESELTGHQICRNCLRSIKGGI